MHTLTGNDAATLILNVRQQSARSAGGLCFTCIGIARNDLVQVPVKGFLGQPVDLCATCGVRGLVVVPVVIARYPAIWRTHPPSMKLERGCGKRRDDGADTAGPSVPRPMARPRHGHLAAPSLWAAQIPTEV